MLYIKDEQVLTQGTVLIELFNEFVKQFKEKIAPIKLAHIAATSAQFIQNLEPKLTFLDKIIKEDLRDEQAITLLRLKMAEF